MSYVYPVNPNAGGRDGDHQDPVMADEFPDGQDGDEGAPEASGSVEVQRPHESSPDDLPYSWSNLDKTEAEE